MADWVGDDGLLDVILEILIHLAVGVAVVAIIARAYCIIVVV